MSVSKKVQRLLEEKPFLLEALAQGYANVSAAARLLQKQTGGSEMAVRAAVKRFTESKLKQKRAEEKKVLDLVKKSKLTLTTKIATLIVERTPITQAKAAKCQYLKAWVEGPSAMTLIVDEDKWDELDDLFTPSEILSSHKNLVALTLISAPQLEEVPGVVAFLTAQLARNNINVAEFWSSYRDTVFLIEKSDGTKAYNALSALL